MLAPVDVTVVNDPMGGLEIHRPEIHRLAAAGMAVATGAERRGMKGCAAGWLAFGAIPQLEVPAGLTVMAGDGVGLLPLRWSARAGRPHHPVGSSRPYAARLDAAPPARLGRRRGV